MTTCQKKPDREGQILATLSSNYPVTAWSELGYHTVWYLVWISALILVCSTIKPLGRSLEQRVFGCLILFLSNIAMLILILACYMTELSRISWVCIFINLNALWGYMHVCRWVECNAAKRNVEYPRCLLSSNTPPSYRCEQMLVNSNKILVKLSEYKNNQIS